MPTSKNIDNLVINKIQNQEVYNYLVTNNLINEDELYLVQGDGSHNHNELYYTKSEIDDIRTFIATYGTTTSDEINAALDAGKAVFCQNGVYRGTYLRKNSDGRRCVFGYATTNGHVELLCDNNKWSSSTTTFAKSSDLNDKIINTSTTLTTGGWSGNSQTVTVTGITTDNTVIVAPAPISQADYTSSNILCSTQASDSLTFTCTDTPTVDITVNIVILN